MMNESEMDTIKVSAHAKYRPLLEFGEPIMGRYVPLNLCGQGAMSTVYRARDLETSETVAVKLIPVAEDRERIRREITALRLIHNPNIVRLLDFAMDDQNAAVVMEYLEGATLGYFLRENGPIMWKTALRIGSEILEGLVAIHEAGLIHCDIKPSNIMVVVSDQARLRILDLGVTTSIRHQAPSAALVAGTPCYMPPEQCAGLRLTPAVDIYALGVMLWQAMTGCVPDQSTMLVPHWPHPASNTPDAVRRLIEVMVEASPSSRYPDASQCLLALRSVLHETTCEDPLETSEFKAVS